MISTSFGLDSVAHAAGGGLILAVVSSIHLLLRGRITGISGITQALSNLAMATEQRVWRAAFLAGMALCACIGVELFPVRFGADVLDPTPLVAISGGLLVGVGTRLGSGCTSGHGVCGLARFSKRSLVAVCTFMATAAIVSSAIDASGGRPALIAPTAPSRPLRLAIGATAAVALAALVALAPAAERGATSKDSLAPGARAEAALNATFGALFAVGLAVSGMLQPSRILGFLTPFAASGWDPTLAFVMAGAVGVNVVTFARILRRSRPVLASAFSLPKITDITNELVLGAALFGAGWGLAGICPGPGFIVASAGKPYGIGFVFAHVVGQAAAESLEVMFAAKTKVQLTHGTEVLSAAEHFPVAANASDGSSEDVEEGNGGLAHRT